MNRTTVSTGVFRPAMIKDFFVQMRKWGIGFCMAYVCAGIFFTLASRPFSILGLESRTVYLKDSSIIPLAVLFFLIIPIALAYHNRYRVLRKSGDFYLSSPMSRRTIFFSISIAVFLWSTIIISAYSLSMVLTSFALERIEPVPGYFFKVYLKAIIIALNINAIFSLGCVIGKSLMDFALNGFILFLFPMAISITVVDGISFFAAKNAFLPIFKKALYSNNALTSVFYSITQSGISSDVSQKTYPVPDIVRCYLITLVEIAVAFFLCYLILKREGKQKKISTRRIYIMDAVLRIGVALMPAVLGARSLLSDYFDGVEIALILFVLTIIVYFVYDIIRNAGFKGIKRAVIQIPILAAITALFFCGMKIVGTADAETIINETTVSEVTFYEKSPYDDTAVNGYTSDSSDMIRIAVNGLNAYGKNGVEINLYQGKANFFRAAFKVNGIKHYRYIVLTSENADELYREISED